MQKESLVSFFVTHDHVWDWLEPFVIVKSVISERKSLMSTRSNKKEIEIVTRCIMALVRACAACLSV